MNLFQIHINVMVGRWKIQKNTGHEQQESTLLPSWVYKNLHCCIILDQSGSIIT